MGKKMYEKRATCPKCGSTNTRFKKRRMNGKYKIFCNNCKHFSDVYVSDTLGTTEDYPQFLDKKTGETVDWREWIDVMEKQQSLHQRQSSSQDMATIRLPEYDNHRAIVLFSADWHLGSISVDYKSFQESIELILNTPHVYMITVGDLTDNFRRFSSLQPVLSQLASPKDQNRMLRSLLNEFWKKKKWIAACWGNHDVQRDEVVYGESTVKDELSKNLVYFNGKGTLKLLVGDQEYIIRMSHDFKGNSIYNQLHAAMREMHFYYPNADIFVCAHKHTPAITNTYEYGQRKCFIRTGAFEIDSGYSKRFWGSGVIGVPAVVLRSDRHEVFAYPGLEELLEIREGVRA